MSKKGGRTTGRIQARLIGFGELEVDGTTYDRDIVVDRGRVRRRDKGPSKARRGEHGHTPLTAAESIPWHCQLLIVGTGANGALPVEDAVFAEATRRGVELVLMPTAAACALLSDSDPDEVSAILHVTC